MKKVLAVIGITAAVFTAGTSKAQLLLGGLKAGVNSSNISGFHDNAESKIGPVGGIFFQYGQKSAIKVGVEFLYSERGVKYNINSTDSVTNVTKDLNYDISFKYIDIPLYVSYNFMSDSAKFRPRVYAGPSFSIRIGAESDLDFKYSLKDSVTSEGNQVNNTTFGYAYSPVDIGVVAGVGMNYMISSKLYATFDARYTMSISDLSENVTNANAIRNKTISVLVGVGYTLGK